MNRIHGGRVAVIGDLHISDRAVVGRHKNYLANCFSILSQIENMAKDPAIRVLIIAGDIIGTVERNLKSREVLALVCKSFKKIKEEYGTTLVCVRGNHDCDGDYPDFSFLESLGYFETATTLGGYFDFYGKADAEIPEIRFHLVDYGKEHEPLNVLQGSGNIVIAHNDFQIPGVTTWYKSKDGVILSSLDNFKGVDFVISGHIHQPSPRIFATQLACDSNAVVQLFYVGSPTRPAETYENCWIFEFNYKEESDETDFELKEWKLKPIEEIMNTEDSMITEETVVDAEEEMRKQNLREVLKEISESNMSTGNICDQIMNIPNATQKAKELAVSYIKLAQDNL